MVYKAIMRSIRGALVGAEFGVVFLIYAVLSSIVIGLWSGEAWLASAISGAWTGVFFVLMATVAGLIFGSDPQVYFPVPPPHHLLWKLVIRLLKIVPNGKPA